MVPVNTAVLNRLGVREIIAALVFAFIAPAQASLSPDWRDIGTVETLNAVGSLAWPQKYLPLKFEGMPSPYYFTVNPEMKTLLISREFIAEHDLWEYKFEREITLPQAGGGLVAGDLVRFYVLVVGTKALSNVQAVICDECNETAGQSLLDQL